MFEHLHECIAMMHGDVNRCVSMSSIIRCQTGNAVMQASVFLKLRSLPSLCVCVCVCVVCAHVYMYWRVLQEQCANPHT